MSALKRITSLAPVEFVIGKATLVLTVDEATDIVTATAGDTVGAAYSEFKFGVETGVYGDIVRVPQNFVNFANPTDAPVVFAVCRNIAADGSVGEWSDEASVAVPVNDFLTFTLPDQVGATVIDRAANTIAINLPDDTDPSALVAEFTVSDEAVVTVGVTAQESGVTENDFTNAVTYTLTKGEVVVEYTVTVTVLKDTAKALTAFSLAEQVEAAVIDEQAHTVAVAVPHGTDVSALVATFTVSAEAAATVGAVAQESGVTANDFTNPVTYRVTAEDESFQDYVVTVTVNAATNDITAFSVPGQEGEAVIDAAAHTVAINVPHEVDASALVATFALTAGASAVVGAVAQESGVTANDFTGPVVYTITGADAAEQAWTVTITVGAATNDITAFSLAEQTGAAVIDPVAHTVAIEVANGTDVDHLVATFGLTAGASAKVGNTVQVSGDTQNDFTAPVVYAVTGATEIAQEWTVTVTVAAL
jgi:hypothetical protein